jgi:hypothetical protein
MFPENVGPDFDAVCSQEDGNDLSFFSREERILSRVSFRRHYRK